MKFIYFGNKLGKHGRSKSVMETLEPLLEEFCEVKTFSSVNNKFLRFVDMLYGFFWKGLRSDLVMVDVYSTLNFYFAYVIALLCIFFKKPYILFLHGGHLPKRYNHSQKKMEVMLNHAKIVIAPSSYLKEFFEAKGHSVLLIPNFIELQKFPFSTREFEYPRLLYIRGFSEIYNPLMTVRAVKLICEKYPYCQLLMIGSDIDGSLAKTINLIKDLGLTNNIKILGRMTQAEWIEASKYCNIMVSNPSIDNTPVSIIEGMALGLVIVSTNVGGISYLLKDKEDALLVSTNDYAELAKSINQIISDTCLRKKLQDNALEKAKSFSWERIKPLWKRVLTNLFFFILINF